MLSALFYAYVDNEKVFYTYYKMLYLTTAIWEKSLRLVSIKSHLPEILETVKDFDREEIFPPMKNGSLS